MRKLLTGEEISELLQVPMATLYAWRHKRSGPPVIKVGRHLRYDPDDLEAWVADQRAPRSAA